MFRLFKREKEKKEKTMEINIFKTYKSWHSFFIIIRGIMNNSIIIFRVYRGIRGKISTAFWLLLGAHIGTIHPAIRTRTRLHYFILKKKNKQKQWKWDAYGRSACATIARRCWNWQQIFDLLILFSKEMYCTTFWFPFRSKCIPDDDTHMLFVEWKFSGILKHLISSHI